MEKGIHQLKGHSEDLCRNVHIVYRDSIKIITTQREGIRKSVHLTETCLFVSLEKK